MTEITLQSPRDHNRRSSITSHQKTDGRRLLAESTATKIDGSSQVINGSVIDGKRTGSVGKHSLEAGSVKNNSKLANGNMDPKSFIAFFCRDR
ncbi:uncharacterized protein N7446_005567 [Penicillium canescens]|uniref:Uncharacterized protein n=1 Tax=Penicillium canescens TaxID=5083 RepID=A0AAD6NBQ3_PENCN|nr:uncharacterized protein N7446_005567 [Penicillium canescens]KAJ6050195.1 hypothetical protein N7444_006911 [Penicillium canescens]KAJ6050939.1 hypothetical protein N7460_001473 [Penicillium canescens]KAJ6061447.1 hypothetical protein N7446_005567 [Penicillium canescens]